MSFSTWFTVESNLYRRLCRLLAAGCSKHTIPVDLFQYRKTGALDSVKAPLNEGSPRSISLVISRYLGKRIVDYPEMMSYRFRTLS
jgi:hypothetical protein